jgi:molybdate transport system substrate-binding protein
MSRFLVVCAAAAAVTVSSFAGSPARADEFTLAAGAGFRRPLAELATAYEKANPHKVLQTYGHVGQVIAQARESGKIALLCGDKAVMEKAQGLSFSSFAGLGLGKLVIAYRKGLTLTKAEDITKPEFKRIGIPDQASAIYGKAGRQFLDRTKLAAQIDARLIPVATVPQVTSYVASGEVDAGFVNATDAIGAGTNIGGFLEVDAKLYDQVEVVCGVIAAFKDAPAVIGFVKYLATEEARGILRRYGL